MRRAREEGGDAEAWPSTNSRKMDNVTTSMGKKPAVASRSRPAILLLLRSSSPASPSASLSVHLNERAIAMVIMRSLAPAVGSHTPILAGRYAGSAAALSRNWRGAASQRVAPCISAARPTAILAGAQSAIGPSFTKAGKGNRMPSDPAILQGPTRRVSTLAKGRREDNESQHLREDAPRAARVVPVARRRWPNAGVIISSGAGYPLPTPPAAGRQAPGGRLPYL